jgi:hypothetical protein
MSNFAESFSQAHLERSATTIDASMATEAQAKDGRPCGAAIGFAIVLQSKL